jgi:two-component system chemotaxis response regulator CheB
VLVVDDSAVLRQQIRFILQADPQLQVVGEAKNGEEAITMARQLRPDIITMDICMPKMDGLDAIRAIMADSPAPIVVVTGADVDAEMHVAAQAQKLGAVSVVHKPGSIAAPSYKVIAGTLVQQVKAMSQVRVVSRLRSHSQVVLPETPPPPAAPTRGRKTEIIAIGASTGGPAALYKVLGGLPASCPVPVVVVQHISLGFVEGLASWLGGGCKLQVRVAKHGEKLQAGVIHIAPDGSHMVTDSFGRVRLKDTPPLNGHRPSVTALFQSVAEAYGPTAIGVILTGMGADGATGLRAMRDAGSMTIAQDEASCVVFGMPKEAIALGAAKHVVPLEKIAATVMEYCIA